MPGNWSAYTVFDNTYVLSRVFNFDLATWPKVKLYDQKSNRYFFIWDIYSTKLHMDTALFCFSGPFNPNSPGLLHWHWDNDYYPSASEVATTIIDKRSQ